jgi:hypothetical protein
VWAVAPKEKEGTTKGIKGITVNIFPINIQKVIN